MIAAAGAGMPAVEHELLGREARLARLPVQELSPLHELIPAMGRMNIDLDDARVRRDFKYIEAWIGRLLVAFQHHRLPKRPRGGFDRAHQLQIILELGKRRHEYVQHSTSGFSAKRAARDA